jgi:hypothetical protein
VAVKDLQVFSREWFEWHQARILRFANSWLGRRFFGIQNDVPKGTQLIRILPNCMTWQNDDGSYSTDFRTHAKFAKRLYYGLKPLWFVLHGWDMVFGQQAKQLNFGFDTLTQYPGSTGADDPVDGSVARRGVSETFATIRGGAGTEADTTTADMFPVRLSATSTTDQYSDLFRGFFDFDTSSLGAGAILSAATISFFGTSKSDGLGGTQAMHVAANTVTSTTALATSDYGNVASTTFGNVTIAAYSTSAYNDIALNASGISNISLTGVSKLATRLACDINNSAPTWISGSDAFVKAYQAEQAGTTNDPKLVVTYNLTTTSTSQSTSTSASTSSTSSSISTSSTSASTSSTSSSISTSTSFSTSSTSSSISTSISTSTSVSTSTSTTLIDVMTIPRARVEPLPKGIGVFTHAAPKGFIKRWRG